MLPDADIDEVMSYKTAHLSYSNMLNVTVAIQVARVSKTISKSVA